MFCKNRAISSFSGAGCIRIADMKESKADIDYFDAEKGENSGEEGIMGTVFIQ